MRTEPCKQCNAFDFYQRGEFSYCRPCHTEAQKRYAQNKRMGISYQSKGGPKQSLETLFQKRARKLKPTCARGHLFAGDNLRLDQYKGKLIRRCRACERDIKRVKYGLKPDPDPVKLSDLLDSED